MPCWSVGGASDLTVRLVRTTGGVLLLDVCVRCKFHLRKCDRDLFLTYIYIFCGRIDFQLLGDMRLCCIKRCYYDCVYMCFFLLFFLFSAGNAESHGVFIQVSVHRCLYQPAALQDWSHIWKSRGYKRYVPCFFFHVLLYYRLLQTTFGRCNREIHDIFPVRGGEALAYS